MRIDAGNYTRYSKDFLAGTLDSETELSFILFLEENPLIEEQLLPSGETGLQKEPEVFFEDKQSLKKDPAIQHRSLDEWLVKELEGDLNIGEEKELAEFLKDHPAYEKDRRLFFRTRLEADISISYASKRKLHKPVWVISYKPVTYLAAASIVLFLGISYLFRSQEIVTGPEIAHTTTPEKGSGIHTPDSFTKKTTPPAPLQTFPKVSRQQPVYSRERKAVISGSPVLASKGQEPMALPEKPDFNPQPLPVTEIHTVALTTTVPASVTPEEYIIQQLEEAKGPSPDIDVPVRKKTIFTSLVALAAERLNRSSKVPLEFKTREEEREKILYVRVGELAFTNIRQK